MLRECLSQQHHARPLIVLSLPQLYLLRKQIEYALRADGIKDDDAYFCSLSSKTIVYKGQLTPEQVRLSLQRSLTEP